VQKYLSIPTLLLKPTACREALIPFGPTMTRPTRQVTKTMKVRKTDVAVVSQVDQSKGNMDLTRPVLKGHKIEDVKKHFTDRTSFMNGM
jgi:translation initiation factor 2 alpha subunit (eIF-2alpha)